VSTPPATFAVCEGGGSEEGRLHTRVGDTAPHMRTSVDRRDNNTSGMFYAFVRCECMRGLLMRLHVALSASSVVSLRVSPSSARVHLVYTLAHMRASSSAVECIRSSAMRASVF
jgi:hypothetical protein